MKVIFISWVYLALFHFTYMSSDKLFMDMYKLSSCIMKIIIFATLETIKDAPDYDPDPEYELSSIILVKVCIP